MITSGLTAVLANRCLTIGSTALPEDIATIAKHSLLDWFSVGRSAWAEEAVQIPLSEIIAEGGFMQATLLNGGRATVNQVAIINGIASHVLDFDDVHLRSRVHPSTPLWSAILAEAEHLNLSGEKVLQAFVAGVEMQSRIAFAMGEDHYGLGWHNTATLGCFGATTAVAVLHQLNSEQLCRAMAISATQAAGMRASFGTMCKPLHAGKAASIGLYSARLAAKGFTAPDGILEKTAGFLELYANDIFAEAATANLNRICAQDIIYKYNSSCYGTQAPIEACKNLILNHTIDLNAISGVTILIEPQYVSVCCIPKPINAAEAKFSIAFMSALALAQRSTVSKSSFNSESLRDPMLLALSDKIKIIGHTSMPRANAEVSIQLKSGETYSQMFNAELPELNLLTQENKLITKAQTLLSENMSLQNVSAMIQSILGIQQEKEINKIMRIIPSC